jgi:hypothetical protein
MAKEKNYKLDKADKKKSGLIILSNFDPKPKNEETEEQETQTEQLLTETGKITKPAKEKKSKKAKKAKASTVENLDTNLNP